MNKFILSRAHVKLFVTIVKTHSFALRTIKILDIFSFSPIMICSNFTQICLFNKTVFRIRLTLHILKQIVDLFIQSFIILISPQQFNRFHVFVVWKLDCLSRSLKDLLTLIEKIIGAGFCSLTEAMDTTTSAGRMMMQMVGNFAEFERAMIRERKKAGLDAARWHSQIGRRRPNSPFTNDRRLLK